MFQKTIVSKYLKTQNQEELHQKWTLFCNHFKNPTVQENIRNSKEEQYQEGFLRDLFVDVFGYTLNPTVGFNLTTELRNIKDTKKADGGIIIDEKVVGVIELKGTNTTDLGKIEQQAFNYKNNQIGCIYVITSNFEKLRFYVEDTIHFQEFNLFDLSQEDFNLLYLFLNFDNLQNNVPKKIKDESVSQEDVITKKLYKDYSVFKRELFQNFVQQNPYHNQLELFKKTQKLLDRLLFLFFGEDRGLLPPNSVRQILEQWNKLNDLDEYVPLYNRFKKYFGYLNTGFKGKNHDVFAYNGGLFKPDEILDVISIDDDLLYKHTLKLSEYDFASEVDVNILGHIFENSLNEIDEIKSQLEGKEVDKSKTKRKKDGVFYTPKYITKYIVENTVGKLCEEKKLDFGIVEEDYFVDKKRQEKTKRTLLDKLENYRKWLYQITIVDPACGSGAFLNEALNFLIEEHHYIDEMETKLTGSSIAFAYHSDRILENNLFGVDLNEESVEIAKLSLWLRTAEPNRKLNNLNDNIKCGNSLIDDPEVAGEKAFHWEKEFQKVFEKGGFDVVIGNPPYVRQEFFKDVKSYLQSNFESFNSVADLYTYFIEKGLTLINASGIFSFILPNKFLKATYGYEIRNYIINHGRVILLYDFDDFPVFHDATTYPLIFIIDKKINSHNNFIYSKINKTVKELPIENLKFSEELYDYQELLKNKEWNFSGKGLSKIIEKIKAQSVPLSVHVNKMVYLGIKTGKNEAFIIDQSTKDMIEKDGGIDIIKPIATGKEIYRYQYINNNKYLLCTDYEIDIPKLYPSVFKWLQRFEEDLKKRGDKGKDWWNLRPCDYYDKIASPKIIWRSISNECGFYLDESGDLMLSNNNYFISSNSFHLLAILNSKISFLILSNICTSLQGGFFDFRRDKVLELPIPIHLESENLGISAIAQQAHKNEFSNLSSKFIRALLRKFDKIKETKKLSQWYLLSYNEFIKELSKQKIKLSLSEEAEWEDYFAQEKQKALDIKNTIDATDKEIDQMVYELYGLTEEEIEIVENS